MFQLLINFIVQIFLFIISYGLFNRSIILTYKPTHPFLEIIETVSVFINQYRHQTANLFTLLVVILLLIQISYLRSSQKIKKPLPYILLLVIPFISYPFLSTDIFNYIFSAKILTFYKTNPYTVKPEIFNNDLWLNFTQWVDHKYAYGPVFLFITALPMVILKPTRFFLNLYGLKFLNLLSFLYTGKIICKHSKENWKLWYLSPLLILEFLINGHNDIYMIMFFILSIHLATKRKITLSVLFYLASVFTKYVSIVLLPIYAYTLIKGKINNKYFKIATLLLLVFILFMGVHPWYLTWLFFTIPFSKLKTNTIISISIITAIKIISTYSCFIKNSQWSTCSISQYALLLFIPTIVIFLLHIIREIADANKNLT